MDSAWPIANRILLTSRRDDAEGRVLRSGDEADPVDWIEATTLQTQESTSTAL